MKYRVEFERPAEKFILKLPRPEQERLLRAVRKLPDEGDIKALKGQKSRGLLRLRVGGYRVIYRVDAGRLIVLVIDAGNRGDIYKQYG